MWFSNEFDQYLLMQQLQAVQHLPESQRNRQTTEIRLYCKGQDIACQTTIRNP
jgi:hypothetical protein